MLLGVDLHTHKTTLLGTVACEVGVVCSQQVPVHSCIGIVGEGEANDDYRSLPRICCGQLGRYVSFPFSRQSHQVRLMALIMNALCPH